MIARKVAGAATALAILTGSSAAVRAADGGGSASVDFTAGSRSDREARVAASFDLRDDWFVAPRAAFFRSDDSPSGFARYGLSGGRSVGAWLFEGDATIQPRVDGYARSSFGGDASCSFGSRKDDSGALEVGAGANLIRHSDLLFAPSGGRGRAADRTSEFVVRESDLSAFAAWRGRVGSLSARATGSSYDRDLGEADARRVASLDGEFGAAVVGFPRASATATARVRAGERWEPFVSVTRTTFELGDPPATAVEAGVAWREDRLELRGSVEEYRQAGSADRRYASVGASLDF